MSSFFLGIILFLFPEWQFNAKPWRSFWENKLQGQLVSSARFSFLFLAIAYPLHYFFVDKKLGLVVDPFWYYYRFGLTIICSTLFLLTFKKRFQSTFVLRLMLLLLGITICYLQSLSILHYKEVPYLWGLGFAILFTLVSLYSTIPSLFFLSIFLLFQYGNLISAGISTGLIGGAYLTCYLIILSFKHKLKDDISSFIKENDFISEQKKMIELQQQLTKQIESFLPKIIQKRIHLMISENKFTILQAIDEVMRVREINITAIFTDIRGYTKASKDIDFLKNSAAPNIRMLTDIAENLGGITRVIGDLLFIYFDNANYNINVVNCLHVGSKIVEINENFNINNRFKIHRHVLIDGGAALVGNFGGHDSSHEITAIGSCVNRLSRIDQLTKENGFKNIVSPSDLTLSDEVGDYISDHFKNIPLQKFFLETNHLQIKDFTETKYLYRLSCLFDDKNKESVA